MDFIKHLYIFFTCDRQLAYTNFLHIKQPIFAVAAGHIENIRKDLYLMARSKVNRTIKIKKIDVFKSKIMHIINKQKCCLLSLELSGYLSC